MTTMLPGHLLHLHADGVGPLTLKRAWPMGAGHLALEYRAADGALVAGQWFRDSEALERVARKTARAGAGVRHPEQGLLLQPGGVDRRLPGLAPLLEQPESQLLVHRAERRAVVKLSAGERVQYAKVVRPARLAALATAHERAAELGLDAFDTPSLVGCEAARGVLWFSALEGESLHDLLHSPRLVDAARRTGESLRALHGAAAFDTPRHGAREEAAVIQQWIGRLEAFGLPTESPFHKLAARVLPVLAEGRSPRALLHRDFYDKQVLIDRSGRVGLLDFDTLARGEAALDVANALVHFELRALQGKVTAHQANEAAGALLEGYRPTRAVHSRLASYASASRLRLACVYAFRPGLLSEALLDAAWRGIAPASAG